VSTQSIKERPLPRFEQRTGLDTEQLLLLEREVEIRIGAWQPATGRRKALELFDAIVVCLIYLRHNTIQAALGEQSRISQATISRCVEALEPVVSVCLDQLALELREQAIRSDLVVDGFLIPTRDLGSPNGLFSGKRQRPGLNAQVITDLHGRVVDGGRVAVGSVHDAKAFTESGLAKAYEVHLTGEGPSLIGDLGYLGIVPLTPYRKPAYRELTTAELLFNHQVNQRRWVVEQGIAHLRSWKILATGYRRPLPKADVARRQTDRLGHPAARQEKDHWARSHPLGRRTGHSAPPPVQTPRRPLGPTPVHAPRLRQARRRAHLLATPRPAGRFWIGCRPPPSPSDLELPIDTQHPPDIHSAFGMQATRASRFLPDGLMNRNWRLDTEQGPFALKEVLDIDAATARKNLAILSSLAASGLPVPAPARTTTGDLVAEIGDRAFYLLSWIEGTRIPGDALTMRQIENLGTLLGRLHLRLNDAAVGLPAPEPAPSTPRTVAEAFEQIAHLKAIIAGQERPDPFDTLAAATFERRKELLDAHHEFVPSNRLPDAPVGWVHGDFHSSNLLWNTDRVTGILDWDRLGAKPLGEEVVRQRSCTSSPRTAPSTSAESLLSHRHTAASSLSTLTPSPMPSTGCGGTTSPASGSSGSTTAEPTSTATTCSPPARTSFSGGPSIATASGPPSPPIPSERPRPPKPGVGKLETSSKRTLARWLLERNRSDARQFQRGFLGAGALHVKGRNGSQRLSEMASQDQQAAEGAWVTKESGPVPVRP
jgi:aminoglycoside phosphotransferase (APT) family kinase protein